MRTIIVGVLAVMMTVTPAFAESNDVFSLSIEAFNKDVNSDTGGDIVQSNHDGPTSTPSPIPAPTPSVRAALLACRAEPGASSNPAQYLYCFGRAAGKACQNDLSCEAPFNVRARELWQQ